MDLSAGLLVAAAVTVGAVAFLLVSDRRRTGRFGLLVVWTAVLALVTAAAFCWIGGGLVWGVAAPGLVIWCAAIATGGKPGVLVDPPPPTTSGAGPSRSAQRERRRHSRRTWHYVVLVALVALVALALTVAGATGHLPWST